MKVSSNPFRSAPLVKEALKLMRSSLPATVEMVQQIATDTDNVMAEATQIHRIVMNLCTNAAQAMEEEGGTLTVTLSQETLAALDIRLHPGLKPGVYLKLSVQDTGKGVAPEVPGQDFRPLFHHQGKRQGHRIGAGPGSWDRPTVRRGGACLQRTGPREYF